MIILLTIILVFYATRLFYTVESFKSQMDYINFNIANFPTNFACWTWLGIEKRIYMNLPYGAMEAWQTGLKYRDNDFRLNWNMADVLAHLGFLDESIRFFEKTKTSALPEGTEEKWNARVGEQIAKIQAIKEKAQIEQQNRIIDQAKELKRIGT